MTDAMNIFMPGRVHWEEYKRAEKQLIVEAKKGGEGPGRVGPPSVVHGAARPAVLRARSPRRKRLARSSTAGRAACSVTDGGPTAPGPPRRPVPPIAHARRLSVKLVQTFSNMSSRSGGFAPARERWDPPACAPGCRPLVRRAAPSAPRSSWGGYRLTTRAARPSTGSSFLKLCAVQIRRHSHDTFCTPRSRNCVKPIADFT